VKACFFVFLFGKYYFLSRLDPGLEYRLPIHFIIFDMTRIPIAIANSFLSFLI